MKRNKIVKLSIPAFIAAVLFMAGSGSIVERVVKEIGVDILSGLPPKCMITLPHGYFLEMKEEASEGSTDFCS